MTDKINNGDKVRVTKGTLEGAVGTYYGQGSVHSEGIGWSQGHGTSDLEKVDPHTPDCDAGGKPPVPLGPSVAKWLASNPANRNKVTGQNPYQDEAPEEESVVTYRGIGRLVMGKHGNGREKRK